RLLPPSPANKACLFLVGSASAHRTLLPKRRLPAARTCFLSLSLGLASHLPPLSTKRDSHTVTRTPVRFQ
ncbi:hypothetical protein CH063_01925, partial [Colletotrichum higginsianum]